MKYAARIAVVTSCLVLALLNVSFAAPFTVATNLIGSGDITITAADTPPAGDNLTVVSAVQVRSTGGNITLNAGDDLTLAPGSTVQAAGNINIMLDFGNADVGVGSTATLAGSLIGQHVTITGGTDIDTLVFQGPPATVSFTGANSGTISAPGMTDIVFSSIENININGVTIAAPVPEPASWLLIASTGLAGLLTKLRRRGRPS